MILYLYDNQFSELPESFVNLKLGGILNLINNIVILLFIKSQMKFKEGQ